MYFPINQFLAANVHFQIYLLRKNVEHFYLKVELEKNTHIRICVIMPTKIHTKIFYANNTFTAY